MKIKKFPVQILISVFFLCLMATFGQEKNKTYQGRKIHYAPEGNSFVLKNGTRKFNRALYGSNTGFRVEAGDLPEFALYMPGMGGNFKLGFQKGDESKWITEAKIIDTRYTLGIMYYKIQDPILGNGELQIEAIANSENIAFSSMWDNYPNSISIPLSGKASQLYLMMTGTTNPMQSRFVNGELVVHYTDGTWEMLLLKNPENWWPIEQDYFVNGLAFTTAATKPPRVYLKSGVIYRTFKDFISVKRFSNYGIDGGAATILDLPLNNKKNIKKHQFKNHCQ